MFLINSTLGWNLGDDLIREGVIRLLGLEDEPKLIVNRAQLTGKRPVHRELSNMPAVDDAMRNARALVIAGTPEWVDFAQEYWLAAVQHRVPIYLVGVGMEQSSSLFLRQFADQIVGATTRDRLAQGCLARAGIRAEQFPDPAFAAEYGRQERRFGLVVNYRAKGGNGAFKDDFDPYWAQVAANFGPAIDLVTVHEPGEYERARRIFRSRVFYSSDWRDYRRIYGATERYLGGRIHGATPVVASGGTAHLVYRSRKADALRDLVPLGETLTVSGYEHTPPTELVARDPEPMMVALRERNRAHAAYWRERKVW